MGGKQAARQLPSSTSNLPAIIAICRALQQDQDPQRGKVLNSPGMQRRQNNIKTKKKQKKNIKTKNKYQLHRAKNKDKKSNNSLKKINK